VHKLSVDLLIVGSHSHGVGAETPLGRTAARVLQLAKVPVYLVPLMERRRREDR
jgi:nucleotide-binding universal stress UspA family protein